MHDESGPQYVGGRWSVVPGMAAHGQGCFCKWYGRDLSPDMVSPSESGLFGEVTRVVGLLSAIGIGALLHTLRVIIISAITATPGGLVNADHGQREFREMQLKAGPGREKWQAGKSHARSTNSSPLKRESRGMVVDRPSCTREES